MDLTISISFIVGVVIGVAISVVGIIYLKMKDKEK